MPANEPTKSAYNRFHSGLLVMSLSLFCLQFLIQRTQGTAYPSLWEWEFQQRAQCGRMGDLNQRCHRGAAAGRGSVWGGDKGVIRGPLENPKISTILRQAIGVPVAIKLLKSEFYLSHQIAVMCFHPSNIASDEIFRLPS